MKCSKCNAENPEIAKFCHNCGDVLEDDITYDNKSEGSESEGGNRYTNKVRAFSIIILFVCLISVVLFFVLISNSVEPSSDSDVEYNTYEESELVDESEEELFMESAKTIMYSSDGYIQHQIVRYYDTNGKIVEEAIAQDDDSWETENIYEYDNCGRISEINLEPYSTYGLNIVLDIYYEDDDGNFVSKGNFYDSDHYAYDVTCKYDNENRLLEFYIYKGGEIYTPDKGDKKIYAYEIRSYYDDGLIEYKESKIEDELIKLFYNEDGSLHKAVRGSTEYFYERYNNIDVLSSDTIVEETENEIKIENYLDDGTVKGYTVWEFDENGNETKTSEYSADYELKSETYYTWIDKSAYFDSYD